LGESSNENKNRNHAVGNQRRGLPVEAEGSYDFDKSNTQNITDINGHTTVFRSDLHATHFLFGPKFQLGTNLPVRAFVFAKGGFIRFGVTPGPVTFGAFPTRLENTDLNGSFYPEGGVEFFLGPIGIRAEAGDEIYFDRGAPNNVKGCRGTNDPFLDLDFLGGAAEKHLPAPRQLLLGSSSCRVNRG